jgi:hypothetical protein
VCAASSARNLRCTACSCKTWPWVKERRKVPKVDGARAPRKATGIAAYRSRSASSMLSAPAHIAATNDITFAVGFAPPLLSAPSIRTAWLTKYGSRPRSANRITGTRPASAIRFGSSNTAETVEAAWDDCISRMCSRSVDVEP